MLIQVVCAGPWSRHAARGGRGAVLGRHDPPLSVECHWEDRRATVVVRGEVDFATAGILARPLDEVACQPPEHLTVDLGLTSCLRAAGLRLTARARRVLTPRCPLTLRSPTRQVRLVLEVSGLGGGRSIQGPRQPRWCRPPAGRSRWRASRSFLASALQLARVNTLRSHVTTNSYDRFTALLRNPGRRR